MNRPNIKQVDLATSIFNIVQSLKESAQSLAAHQVSIALFLCDTSADTNDQSARIINSNAFTCQIVVGQDSSLKILLCHIKLSPVVKLDAGARIELAA